MVTIYHNLALSNARLALDMPQFSDLELVGIALNTDNLDEAFDLTIHRDGENWTDDNSVMFFGDRRSRRSSHEGDVFILSDGTAHLVLTQGFRHLPHLRLPFL
ncbi:MAG: hypothetical protein ACRYFS_08805 [Janthinobacterium lividum]